MHKLINYKIENGELYLNIELDTDNIDFSSEFGKEFLSETYNKIRNEVQSIIKKHKINFHKGKVFLLVNGTLITSLLLTTGCATTPQNDNNNPIIDNQDNNNLVIENPNYPNISIEEPDNINESENPPEDTPVGPIVEFKLMNLILIAGHADKASDPGAVYNNRYEFEYAQELVSLIKSELAKKEGININIISEPATMALEGEMAFLKSATADYAISIHFNAGGGSGTEIIVPHGFHDLTIAEEVINNFKAFNQPIRTTSIFSRSTAGKTVRKNGVRVTPQRDYYGIIRAGQEVNMHSEIIEIEFIDNETNMRFYDANKIKYAQAIADAIEKYYEINFIV